MYVRVCVYFGLLLFLRAVLLPRSCNNIFNNSFFFYHLNQSKALNHVRPARPSRMELILPNHPTVVSTVRTKNRKTLHSTAEADTIQWLLAMCSTSAIEWSANSVGVTFPQFGYVAILCKYISTAFLYNQIQHITHHNLCSDEKYVALKVVKSASHYTETAADEIRLLEVIGEASSANSDTVRSALLCNGSDRIVRLLNHFTVRGVNGVHTCLVFEALGCSLYRLIVRNNYQGLVLAQVKTIVRQVLAGLDFLHSRCHIIHTDIKPENILLVVDNAAAMNAQIDAEIATMRVQGGDFPESYGNSLTLKL